MSNVPLPESLTSDQEKALLAEAKTGPFRHTTPSYGNDMQSGETPRLSSKRHAGSTPPTAPAPVVLLPEPDCRLPMDGPPRYRADQMHAHAAAVSAAKDAEIAALRAEVAGLREDAERYRHMRNNSQFQSRNGPGLYWYLPRYGQGDEGEQLDAAIDATIDAARKGEATTPPPSLSPRS